MSHAALTARIYDAHNAVMADARSRFSIFSNAPTVQVYFYETGRSAGIAHGSSKIGYNIHIAAQDIEKFIDEVIPHEIAHAVCSYLRWDKGHGKHWRVVCRALGGNGERTFNKADVCLKMARHRKQYEYRASCGTLFMLSDVRHNKLQQGASAGYVLRRTGGKFSRDSFTGKFE